MFGRTARHLLVVLLALGSLLGWQAVAAAEPQEPGPRRGMQQMHELMDSGNPGMAQMHERMVASTGARRAHEQMMRRAGMPAMEGMTSGGAGS